MIGNVDIHLSTFNCHAYSAGFVSVSFFLTKPCTVAAGTLPAMSPKKAPDNNPRKAPQAEKHGPQVAQPAVVDGKFANSYQWQKETQNKLFVEEVLLITWFGKAKTAENLLVVPAQEPAGPTISLACTATENQRCSHLRWWCQRVSGGGTQFMKSTSWSEESVKHGLIQ